MELSNDIISQFVKATNDKPTEKKVDTVYATFSPQNNKKYVKIDGSDLLTPVQSTVALHVGDRVMVAIKNHSAIVTSNISSPSISKSEAYEIYDDSEEELVTSVGNLQADNVQVNTRLTANEAEIDALKNNKLDTAVADITYATIANLESANTSIRNLESDYGEFKKLSTDTFSANESAINDLKTNKLDTETADVMYANIGFTNINKSAMEYFYAQSGLIKNVTIGDQTITGELVGVTIKGDLIEGNTIVADKLVIQGNDGLYYRLNTEGDKTEASQTDYNSLNGQVIRAKSITSEKISVEDLVSFGATIGGFKITKDSIYSGVKETADNTTRGIYLDNDGQIAFGDDNSFIRFFKDTDDKYKLLISGAVTANDNFKILSDGSIEAINGKFKGAVDADSGTIAGISISDGLLSAMTMDADNIPTGFELKSDGTFVSKGGSNYNYVYNLNISGGAIQLSSFYSPSGSNGHGAILSADGLYFKDGDSDGETLGSIYQNLGGQLVLNSVHSGIDLNAKGLVNIQNGLRVNNIIGNFYQTYANANGGTNGYLNIAEIKITQNHSNGLIELVILRRGDNVPTKILTRFQNANNTDPSLEIFDVSNSGVKAYIAKTDTSTWNIYVQKSEACDNIAILSCSYNVFQMGEGTVTYKNEFVSSLPSGYTQSSYASGFSWYQYSQVYCFHESPSMMKGRSLDGGFDFYFKEGGMRIVFDGSNGKIWRVDTSGVWTTLAG